MTPAIIAALDAADIKREAYEAAQMAAEEALTIHFEALMADLAKRFPKRRFRADSGMGSLSVGADSGGGERVEREYVWIWNSYTSHQHNPVWTALAKGWEELLDAFAIRLNANYVNFTRDIVAKGERYQE